MLWHRGRSNSHLFLDESLFLAMLLNQALGSLDEISGPGFVIVKLDDSTANLTGISGIVVEQLFGKL